MVRFQVLYTKLYSIVIILQIQQRRLIDGLKKRSKHSDNCVKTIVEELDAPAGPKKTRSFLDSLCTHQYEQNLNLNGTCELRKKLINNLKKNTSPLGIKIIQVIIYVFQVWNAFKASLNDPH